MKKDIVIIGSGPGGYTAAEIAGKSGFNTALIEMENLGGICLNKGCIPTKTLYKEAELIENMVNSTEHGVVLDGFQTNLEIMRERKNLIIERLKERIFKLMEISKVELIGGRGSIKDKNHVVVQKDNGEILEIETKYIIIATGSKPERLDISGKDLEGVMTCEQMLDLDKKMDNVIIIGGGVIGIEMAGILSAFGSRVKIVEARDKILYNVDKDISRRLYKSLTRRGVEVYTSCNIKEIKREKSQLCAKLSYMTGDFKLYGDVVMMSTGRIPVMENLNLEEVGIKYDDKGIIVDNTMRTSVDNIYAVGDVTGGMMLAHVAFHQAIKAVKNIMGEKDIMEYEKAPYCIFTFPEIAGVGLTESQALERGIKYKVGESSFLGCGRALAMGESDGFVKLICNENEEIIGAHIIGPHASDVIHEGVLAVNKGLKVDDIINCIHAHPTLSECVYDAACSIKNK